MLVKICFDELIEWFYTAVKTFQLTKVKSYLFLILNILGAPGCDGP